MLLPLVRVQCYLGRVSFFTVFVITSEFLLQPKSPLPIFSLDPGALVNLRRSQLLVLATDSLVLPLELA